MLQQPTASVSMAATSRKCVVILNSDIRYPVQDRVALDSCSLWLDFICVHLELEKNLLSTYLSIFAIVFTRSWIGSMIPAKRVFKS